MDAIDVDLPTEQVVDAALKSSHTRVPLWRGEREEIVGILHAKTLLRALREARGDLGKLDIMSLCTPPWFVPDSTTLKDQLNAFLKRKAHFAIVVDEYGEVMGLVTLEDIIEEIVGDITDETDIASSAARVQPDGSLIVDGSVPIRDVNRMMDWNIPDDEATTIAGLVIHEAQAIPYQGQRFNFHGFLLRGAAPAEEPHYLASGDAARPPRARRSARKAKPLEPYGRLGPLFRRERGDRKRMHAAGKLLGQRRIDHAVTLKPRFAGKGRRDHRDAEMALSGSGARSDGRRDGENRSPPRSPPERKRHATFSDRLLRHPSEPDPFVIHCCSAPDRSAAPSSRGGGMNVRGDLLKPRHRSVQGNDPHHRIEVGQGRPSIRHVKMGPRGKLADNRPHLSA